MISRRSYSEHLEDVVSKSFAVSRQFTRRHTPHSSARIAIHLLTECDEDAWRDGHLFCRGMEGPAVVCLRDLFITLSAPAEVIRIVMVEICRACNDFLTPERFGVLNG